MRKPSKKYIWDNFVSPYIRLRDTNWNGFGKCISCGKTIKWNDCDAGHFLPKSRGDAIYFEEDNIHAQCANCNRFGSQHTGYLFGKALENKIGEERIERLFKLQRETTQFTIKQLLLIKQLYREKLEEIKQRRAI